MITFIRLKSFKKNFYLKTEMLQMHLLIAPTVKHKVGVSTACQ